MFDAETPSVREPVGVCEGVRELVRVPVLEDDGVCEEVTEGVCVLLAPSVTDDVGVFVPEEVEELVCVCEGVPVGLPEEVRELVGEWDCEDPAESVFVDVRVMVFEGVLVADVVVEAVLDGVIDEVPVSVPVVDCVGVGVLVIDGVPEAESVGVEETDIVELDDSPGATVGGGVEEGDVDLDTVDDGVIVGVGVFVPEPV